MAAAPAKSSLHRFPLAFPKWGSKCSVNGPQRCRRPVDSPPPPPTTTDKDDDNLCNHNLASRNRTPPGADADFEAEPAEEQAQQKHWNLRPRRAAAAEIGCVGQAKNAACSPESESLPKSMRLRGLADGGSSGLERREKRKFWVALTKEEIEEDIYSLTGSKPSRRPRKRPRNVQKQLESVFPGLWLVGISPEAYRSLDAQTKR